MLNELEHSEFERIRSLFRGFDYSLSIQAAIAGNNPGRVFVDNTNEPHTALALTVEGYLLAGDHDDLETNAALRRLFKERIFSRKVFLTDDDAMDLAVHPVTWEARLPEIIPTHKAEKVQRYHYLCRGVDFDWHNFVPQGYKVCRVDRRLLGDDQIVFANPVRGWMDIEENWLTVDNFLAKAASFVVLKGHEVVAWCTPDCVAGSQIDVGIITHPSHRQRGLATVAVAATAEYCLDHGFSAVGWHCNVDNVGSWKTAEKVGFKRNCEYEYYYYIYDTVDHLAELGWYHYRRGEYAKTVQYYEQVFALRSQSPGHLHHLAASAHAHLGNTEMALRCLLNALDHGWADLEWTKQQKEFGILHNTPEWKAI